MKQKSTIPKKKFSFLMLLIMVCWLNTIQAQIYVNINAGGNNDGTTWTDAFTDLQDAIDAAVSSDEIWIAAGTYVPTKDKNGVANANDRDNTFFIDTDGIEIYGGFAGGETMLSQRNAAVNITILSGDMDNDGSIFDNAYRVMDIHNVTNATLIDGLTITKGNATSFYPNGQGGGIDIEEANLIVSNCIITENRANYGAGIYNLGNGGTSNPTFINCMITSNTAIVAGKGSAGEGAGFYNNGGGSIANPTLINCVFRANNANNYGGGMYNYAFNGTSNPILINCTFTLNTAGISSGGMYNITGGTGTINSALTNCIFWDNTANTNDEIENVNTPTPTFTNCIIKNSGGSSAWDSSLGTDGGNNLDSDPLFVDAANGDVSLQLCSPAINAGDDVSGSSANTQSDDIAGNARFFSSTIIDIGAYEFQQLICAAPSNLTANSTTTSVDLGWTENGTATSWDIEWGIKNFVQGTGTTVSGTANNPYNLTGLTANTTYEFYVRADCSMGLYSCWVGPFEWTTQLRPVNSVPFNSPAQFSPTNINLASGAFTWQQSDITLLSQKTAANTFTRYYNSQMNENSVLGHNWSHSYNIYLTINGNDWTVHHGDGHLGYFEYDGSKALPKYIGVTDSMYQDMSNYILLQDDGMKYTFDNTGELQTIEDINGNTTTFTYTSGNLTKVTFPTGRYFDFTYTSNRITTVTDNASRSITFTYDGNGDLTQATTLLGGNYQYTYSNHQLTQVQDANNNIVGQGTYNGDKVSQHINANGGTYAYAYNTPETNACTVTDPLSNTMVFYHDNAYRLIQQKDGLGNSIYLQYNDLDQVTAQVNQESDTTHFTYDFEGNVTQLKTALGATTAITYNALNKPTSLTNALGNTTAMTYDANGNLTGVTYPNATTAAMTYNGAGQIASSTDGNNVQTTYQYAPTTGDLTGIVTTSGTISLSYDGVGRATAYTNRIGKTTQIQYDNAGNTTKVTDPMTYEELWSYDANSNATTYTDKNGATTTYAYNTANNITQITDALNNTTGFTYDLLGQLTTLTDAKSNNTTYAYDANGQITGVTTPLGTTTYSYDSRGNQTGMTDALSRTTQLTYDKLNRLTAVQNPLSQTTAYTYNNINQLTKITDAAGNDTEYTFDAVGQLTQAKDALNGTNDYTYDANGNVLTATNPNGQTTTFTYNDDGLPLTRTDAAGNVITYAYDNDGNLTSQTDAKGIATTFAYNDNTQLTLTTFSNSSTIQYAYDNNGQLTSVTNRIGKTTQFDRDVIGNLTKITDPMGYIENFTYDANSNLSAYTDKNGATTAYTYDGVNNLTQITDALGNTTGFTYDVVGQLTTLTNAKGNNTTYTYDANGQVTGVTTPLGTTTYDYDNRGNQTSVTDALNNTTQLTYDNLNRLTAVQNPLNQTTTYAYNALGQLTNVTDPANNSTTYTYDNIGQLTQAKDALNGTNNFTYDANGNISIFTNANGKVESRTYNDDNQLLTKTDPAGHTTTLTYDNAGNIVTVTDANGVIKTFTRNDNSEITQMAYSNGSTYQYALDNNGYLTGMTNANGSTAYVRDALGQITQMTDLHGLVTKFLYDEIGNRTGTIYSGTDTVNVTYNAANLPTQIKDWAGNFSNRTYNANGQLTNIANSNGTTTNITYDAEGRLATYANYQPGNVLINSETLTYDAMGNITNIARVTPATPPFLNQATTYAHGDDNRLSSTSNGTYTTNDNGGITDNGQGGTYTWGEDDLLTSYTYNGVTTQNTHDANRNLIKEVKGGVETRYQVDATGELSHVLRTLDDQNTVTASYIQTPNGLGWRLDDQGDAQFYAFDYIGHTKALTDDNGNITDTYAADPFGNFAQHTGTTNQPFQQWGKYGIQYKDNGHYHIRARDYQATVGTFISKDFFPSDNRETQKSNRYAFVLNNPMQYVNIDGFSTTEMGMGDFSFEVDGVDKRAAFGLKFDFTNVVNDGEVKMKLRLNDVGLKQSGSTPESYTFFDINNDESVTVKANTSAPKANLVLKNRVVGLPIINNVPVVGLPIPPFTISSIVFAVTQPTIMKRANVPNMALGSAILKDDQIATLLVNHGVDSYRVADMVAQISSYLLNAFQNSSIAVANGMNSLINSNETDWENISNIRSSLADLIGGIQKDQSNAIKEGLAALLTGAGESQQKTNLLAERLSNLFIETALSQQTLVNAALNDLVKSNIGNLDNANTIINQLTNAFTVNQATDESALNAINVLKTNTPQPIGGAVLNPGVPIGRYVAGASAAAYGNTALDALGGY